MNIEKFRYALGHGLFVVGGVAAIMIMLELFVMHGPFYVDGFRIEVFGYPWSTERVTAQTDFLNMPDWTAASPNVYLLNYGEALVGAIFFAVLGIFLAERESPTDLQKSSNVKLSRMFKFGYVASQLALFYTFLRLQVLSASYLIGNTLYFADDSIHMTSIHSSFYSAYHLDPASLHVVFFPLGVYGPNSIGTLPINWDDLLMISAVFTLIFSVLWKYYAPSHPGYHETQPMVEHRHSVLGKNFGIPTLSVILPTKNEVGNIDSVIRQIDDLGLNKEIIVVDDESTDGTFQRLKELSKYRNDLIVIERLGESGISSAIKDALPHCRGKYISVMDADLQHPPSALKGMLDRIKDSETDLVVGARIRNSRNVFGAVRKLVSSGAAKIAYLLLPETRAVSDPMSGLFMFRNGLVKPEHIGSHTFKVLLEIMVNSKPEKIDDHPFEFAHRNSGYSKFNIREVVRYILLVLDLAHYRPVKFLAVGMTGVLINEGLLYVLNSTLNILFLASIIAVETSILSNFALNNKFTFEKRGGRTLATKLAGYNLIALGGLSVNTGTLMGLTVDGWPYLLANIVGTVFGFTVNYIGSEKLVWRQESTETSPN